MLKKMMNTRSLCIGAAIAGLYAALTLLLAPISYGNLQCRVSEALTLLPVVFPEAIPGLTVGCLIANLIGSSTPWDIVFGTLATLLAALLTWATRHTRWTRLRLPILSAVWPVAVNALIVGTVLSLTLHLPLLMTMLEVGVGEAAALCLGLLLFPAMERVERLPFMH